MGLGSRTEARRRREILKNTLFHLLNKIKKKQTPFTKKKHVSILAKKVKIKMRQ